MIAKFKNFINKYNLFALQDKILLAVSGGRDSMVMLDLFLKSGFKFGVAHANFHLRNADSNKDQEFVKLWALNHSITFHTVDFDTLTLAKKDKISVEMAARNLRYKWFELLLKEYKYKFVATAHHADDVVETFHLNLLRATGLEGLTGIKPKKNNIIRPLLFMYRADINAYVDEHKINYREDYTNSETDILRNKFRLLILPQIKQIQANYPQQIIKTVSYLNQAKQFIKNRILKIKKETFSETNLFSQFDFSSYSSDTDFPLILFELLHEYGFDSSQLVDLQNSLLKTETVYFETKTHCFAAENGNLYIQKSDFYSKIDLQITKIDDELFLAKPFDLKLSINRLDKKDFKLDKKLNFAFLDVDNLSFPLRIRNWKSGDFFYPLGMKGKKKISDFLIDLKLNYFEKKATLVLEDTSNQIVWVLGKRIDERAKITNSTKNIIKFTLEAHKKEL